MNKYEFIIYYLYGNGDKDWIDILVDAENLEKATKKAKNHRRWIYKVELISINGEKV